MWLQGLLAVIQVLPTLVQAIQTITKQVEKDSPAGGGGAAKKAAVVGIVRASVNAADKFSEDGEVMDQNTKDAIVQVAGEATDLVVEMNNVLGTFTHGGNKE